MAICRKIIYSLQKCAILCSTNIDTLEQHTSQFQGLCSREMLQNVPYFWNNKTQIVFFHFLFQPTLDLLKNIKKKFVYSHSKNIASFE